MKNTMTVADLIAELQDMPQDLPVRFAYNYGDHWHTTVAASVKSVEVGATEHSDYHDMHKCISLNDEETGEETGEETVILSTYPVR